MAGNYQDWSKPEKKRTKFHHLQIGRRCLWNLFVSKVKAQTRGVGVKRKGAVPLGRVQRIALRRGPFSDEYIHVGHT